MTLPLPSLFKGKASKAKIMITQKAMAKATKKPRTSRGYTSISGPWISLDDVGEDKRQQSLIVNSDLLVFERIGINPLFGVMTS